MHGEVFHFDLLKQILETIRCEVKVVDTLELSIKFR